MAKPKAPKGPSPDDVLRLGPKIAGIKAAMPKKQWAKFVKLAHSRGHTIAGELSDAPSALKERTSSSLRDEARKTVTTAYAPATKALSTREAAIGYLDEKRKADDASYRQWLIGETGKIQSQARAADATLISQQNTIAQETKDAIAAARADSLGRVAGGVSDPTQSTALDTSAADVQATKHVEAARTQTAGIMKIGEDARTMASAAVLAQQAAREATRQGDTWKALGEVSAERTKLLSDQAGATTSLTTDLLGRNAEIVKGNRDADLAAASLDLKGQDLAAQIKAANQKYKIESKKFGLAEWSARNKKAIDQAKIDLGYDKLVQDKGQKEADRQLKDKIEGLRDADRDAERDRKTEADKKDPKKPSVSQAEKDIYKNITHVQGLFTRWDKNNAVPFSQRVPKLLAEGWDAETIAIARELARNKGVMTDSVRARVRKIGVPHSGYFWPVTKGPYDNRTHG